MAKHSLKILRCEHRKNFKVCLAILQHYAWKGKYNFVFHFVSYLQVIGCAMGIICAPAYENIFTVQFGKQHFYPCIKNKSILYLWYGIIMIWTGTKQELLAFPENLNSKHKTIKFEHNFSYSNIFFSTHWYIKTEQHSSDNSLPKIHWWAIISPSTFIPSKIN